MKCTVKFASGEDLKSALPSAPDHTLVAVFISFNALELLNPNLASIEAILYAKDASHSLYDNARSATSRYEGTIYTIRRRLKIAIKNINNPLMNPIVGKYVSGYKSKYILSNKTI